MVELPRPATELPAGLVFESLKNVLEVSEQGAVIPEDVLALCRWAQEYYCAPLGEVLNCAAPAAALGLKNAGKKTRAVLSRKKPDVLLRPPSPELTIEQKKHSRLSSA